MMSKEQLLSEAKRQTYKPEILEKVYNLVETLAQFEQIPFLKDKLVLKGGTALNLFQFDEVPRLSVDIDLNYIGQLDRSEMIKERPLINDAIEKILTQNHFERHRSPNNHAGGKIVWRYPSALGQKGNLEIDLNYMYRQPLLPIKMQSPKLNNGNHFAFPVLDIHELAAGKLSALMTRTASRDLYDAHHLLIKHALNKETLRFAFVVYMGMTNLDPSRLSPSIIQYDLREMHNRLMPVLQQEHIPRTRLDIKKWAETLTTELREALSILLPLTPDEFKFIDEIRKSGRINASLLTNDSYMQTIVTQHPAIQWAAKRTKKQAPLE